MKKDTSSVPFSPYQKFVIFILALTQFSVILDFMVMSPLGDMLMKSMNLTTDQFGLSVAAYAISAGISGLLTAGFADRFDRKRLLVFFYIGFIVGTAFCAMANSYVTLIAARIFTGIFGGVIGSIGLAILTDLFDMHHRGRAMGFIQMGFGASQVLGIPISLHLANKWGWQAPFILVVGIGIVAALLIMTKLQPITTHIAANKDRNVLQHLWKTASKRHHRMAFLSTCILSLGGFMMMPFGSAFAINNLGITDTQLPNLFMFAGIGTLFIMPIVGKLSDKIDKFLLFTIGSLWMIVLVVIYANLGISPFWLVVMLNVLMMMGVMGRMIPATAMVTGIPDMADRGAFMSINSSLQQIAGGFAAAFAGTIVLQPGKHAPLQHYDTLGYIVCAISLLAIFMMYRVSVLTKNKMKEQKL